MIFIFSYFALILRYLPNACAHTKKGGGGEPGDEAIIPVVFFFFFFFFFIISGILARYLNHIFAVSRCWFVLVRVVLCAF